MEADLTISELLAKAGFTHTKCNSTSDTYAHEIKDSYGNTVGFMTAHRAVEFLALGFLGYGAA